jgi:hypothetical protein
MRKITACFTYDFMEIFPGFIGGDESNKTDLVSAASGVVRIAVKKPPVSPNTRPGGCAAL